MESSLYMLYVVVQLRGCAIGGITVDPAMGGGNRLQIRDQRPRYTPGADFEWIWRKLKFVETKGGPLENLFRYPSCTEEESKNE